MKRERLLAYASIYLFWGSTYLAIRVAVRSLPPFLMSGLRMLAAGALLLAVARWRGVPWPTRRQWRDAGLMGLLLLTFGNGVAAWGLRYIESGLATLLTASIPLLSLAYAEVVKGKPVRRADLPLLFVGLLGVALLLKHSPGSGEGWAWGVGAVLWCIGLWAVVIAESERFQLPADGQASSGAQMLVAGAGLLLLSAAFEAPAQVAWASVPAEALWAWAYLVVFGSCVGYLSFNWLLKHEPPHLVGTYAYVNPVVAVALGWLLLGEQVTGRTLLASALIVASVAGVVALRKN